MISLTHKISLAKKTQSRRVSVPLIMLILCIFIERFGVSCNLYFNIIKFLSNALCYYWAERTFPMLNTWIICPGFKRMGRQICQFNYNSNKLICFDLQRIKKNLKSHKFKSKISNHCSLQCRLVVYCWKFVNRLNRNTDKKIYEALHTCINT